MNKEEPSYCLENMIECTTTLGPLFSSAMSSADFPWIHVILLVLVTIGGLQ